MSHLGVGDEQLPGIICLAARDQLITVTPQDMQMLSGTSPGVPCVNVDSDCPFSLSMEMLRFGKISRGAGLKTTN